MIALFASLLIWSLSAKIKNSNNDSYKNKKKQEKISFFIFILCRFLSPLYRLIFHDYYQTKCVILFIVLLIISNTYYFYSKHFLY